MRDRFPLVAALLALGLGLWAFYAVSAWASRGGDQSPLYSARRHDPYGTAALLDLLRERGYDVRTLERSQMQEEDRGVLIQVLPVHSPAHGGRPNVDEAAHSPEMLKSWMAEGNTIIQLSRGGTALMSLCANPPATAPATAPATMPAIWPAAATPVGTTRPFFGGEEAAAEIERLEIIGRPPDELPYSDSQVRWLGQPGAGLMMALQSPTVFSPNAVEPWHALARLPAGIVAQEMRVGLGRLIVIGAPTPAINGGLEKGDNLALLLALIAHQPVLLDEWSHGIGTGGTVMGVVRRMGLLPVIFQVLVVIALYHWSTRGHRQRDNQPLRRRRSSAEQIHTLGYLYSQSLDPVVTFRLVSEEVRRRMAQALRCTVTEFQSRLGALPPTLARYGVDAGAALEAARPVEGPACPACGYDLTTNTSGVCPECGTKIPLVIRERIAAPGSAAATVSSPGTSPAGSSGSNSGAVRRRTANDLCRALTLSHQFVLEATRDRRSKR